jgi:hypothetical protein
VSFPESIAAAHRPVWNEIVLLHARWHQWKTLFASERASVDILNATAPIFFAHVQQVLVSDVLLGLSRLFDPPVMGTKENASLRWVLDAVKEDGRNTLAEKLESALAAVAPQIEAARKHRHKRIAHNDRATFLATGTQVLPSISDSDISTLLDAAAQFLNLVTKEYAATQTVFDYMDAPGDAESLVKHLDHAIQFRTLYFEHKQAGTETSLRW